MWATTFLLAVREIRRHLLRSFLTILGIVIGVWAVVTMVTLGNGATQAVKQQISALGSNVLQVRPGQGFGRGGGGPQPADFKIEDLDAIRVQIVGVVAVAPLVQSTGTAVYNAANWSTTVNGTNRSVSPLACTSPALCPLLGRLPSNQFHFFLFHYQVLG